MRGRCTYQGRQPTGVFLESGVLLAECRRLVLAMVAAWRCDVRDSFPKAHHYGRDILVMLRQGPPWPALGALAAE